MKEQKKSEKQQNRWLRGTITLIAYMLTCGNILAFSKSLSGTGTEISFLELFCAGVLGMLCCELAYNISRKTKAGWVLVAVPWILALAVTQMHGYFAGMKAWINGMIHNWNRIHEGGLSLFSGSMTRQDVWAFAIVCSIAIGGLSWWLVNSRHLMLCWVFSMIWLILMVLSGTFYAHACGFMFCGMFGIFAAGKDMKLKRTGIRWLASIVVITVVATLATSDQTLSSVAQFREQVKKDIHDARYGKERLAAGDLAKAGVFQQDTDKMIRVTSEQKKNLYIKAFVGGIYRNGNWEKMPDSEYGGDNAGMLAWLKEQNFDPLTQVSQYYGLCKKKPTANRVKIKVSGASRDYFYTTGTLKNVDNGKYKEKYDYGLRTKGILGERDYQFKEVFSSKPAELTVAENWLQNPKNKKQKTYSEAESVYRKYVYEHYTTVDDTMYQRMKEIFWKEYDAENDGIYSALTQIRKKLKENYSYKLYPDLAEKNDVLTSFLNGESSGNSMLFASAAVEAFRTHGIPARYVEGYYVSADQIEKSGDGHVLLSGQDMHAWTEVYFDGVGWLPVDVTPGYYYDTAALQNMVNTPDNVQKNAALKNNSFSGKQMSDRDGNKEKVKEKIKTGIKNITMVLLGVLAVLILCAVAWCLVLEIGELIVRMKLRIKYQSTSEEDRIIVIGKEIYLILRCLGMEASLGWNTKETDQILCGKFDGIENGEYTRVCGLLEKQIYGGIPLENYEERTLKKFLLKLIEGTRKRKGKIWLRLRYRHFVDAAKALTNP